MIFIVLLILAPSLSEALNGMVLERVTVPIEPFSENCYSEDVKKDIEEIQVNFKSVRDVQFSVKTNGILHFNQVISKGYWLEKNVNFDFYQFCIKNDRSEKQKVDVSIWHLNKKDLIAEKKLAHMSEDQVIKLGSLALPAHQFMDRVAWVGKKLKEAQTVQSFFRKRETEDLEVAERTSNVVVFWSFFMISYTFFMMIGETFAIRTLFEEHSFVGKILRKGKFE